MAIVGGASGVVLAVLREQCTGTSSISLEEGSRPVLQTGSDFQVAMGDGDGKAKNLIIPLWKCTVQGPVLVPS